MNAIPKPQAVSFRPMYAEDLDAVVEIEKAAYPFPWTLGNFRDCLECGYSCWVAVLGGEIVGYSVLMTGAGEGHILNCCVAPAHQGRGLGRRVMDNLTEAARGYGVDCLFLEVRPSNHPALALYQRLGYETIGLRRGYYPAEQGREDALVMRYCL
jgi:ribosomal-protein-alanine N-acetyltransferase